MSGSFWRFGNGYNEVSSINTLLEDGFLEKNKKPGDLHQQRQGSISSSDSDDSQYKTNDDTIDDEDEEANVIPNIEILGKLLDEQDLLDELASSNIKLIQYLRHREVLDMLIDYIITAEEEIDDNEGKKTPTSNEINENEDEKQENTNKGENASNNESDSSDSDSDDMQQFEDQKETPQEVHARRAQVAAEILSFDAWSLTDSFMDNQDLLSKLWTILDKESPLSMVLSTYFMKINEHLLDMKIDEMLSFLLTQTNIVDRFLKHIDNPPLMDFLLKVISTDKADSPSGIIDLLQEQDLISKLVSFLDPKVAPGTQSAAADFIKAYVAISANSNADNSTIGPNEMTRELVSEPIMEKLSDFMLHGGTSLSNGVAIIIEIIRKNNSDYDFIQVLFITIESHPPTSRDPIYLGNLIKVFSKKIAKFAKMLRDSKLSDLQTPFGKIEPLGFQRFKICEMIAELLHCSNMGLLNDASGEEIVRERDLERIRVISLEKQTNADNTEFEYDIDNEASRDIQNLRVSSPSAKFEEAAETEENDDKENVNAEYVLESEIETEATTTKNKDEKDLSSAEKEKRILESEPDSEDIDAISDLQYDEHELQMRKERVVGDQLKIALADNSVILTILKMFFHFPWNNFLHNVVFDIVQQILNGSMEVGYNKYLAIDIFGRGDITRLIIDGQKKCEDYELETGLRLGYMGHLTLIAEEVVKFTALYPPSSIHKIVLDAVSTQEWNIYVTETLVETREKYNALLGGGVEGDGQVEGQGESDESEEGQKLILDPNTDHDIAGSGYEDKKEGEDAGDDQFSRYMSQQLTNDLPDKFGSSDEDDDEDDLVGWTQGNYGNQAYQPSHQSQYHIMNNDDDDYVDPNDDGQSYTKKDHPLYSNMMSPMEDRSGYAEDDDEDDEEYSDGEDENADGTGLTRSKSNTELNWDEEEQQRIMNMSNYIKNHNHDNE